MGDHIKFDLFVIILYNYFSYICFTHKHTHSRHIVNTRVNVRAYGTFVNKITKFTKQIHPILFIGCVYFSEINIEI